ncbi:MAG TPA: RNA polymerase sigma factor [Gammaproteobacteria bacterium]|nr:RNA polymerase sigma factor [Gammaproteobacteria bacterium]
MSQATDSARIDFASLADAELVALARGGQREAFRHIMQRGNQRLFRIARSVLNDDAEAEDALQEAYLRAFSRLAEFRGDAGIFTWLTRIVLNEAYGRLRTRRTTVGIDQIERSQMEDDRIIRFPSRFGEDDPLAAAAHAQVRRLVEAAVETLPEPFRTVLVMRDIDECSTEETANALGIRVETVKTRLHRARRLLRKQLHGTLSTSLGEAFPFLGVRCARMTAAVLGRLPATVAAPPTSPDPA